MTPEAPREPVRTAPDQFCRCGRPVTALKSMLLCQSGMHPAFCTASHIHLDEAAVSALDEEALARLLSDVRADSNGDQGV